MSAAARVLLAAAGGHAVAADSACFDQGGKKYTLETKAQGTSFFDMFTFPDEATSGPTHGVEEYVTKETAVKKSLIEAHDTHAILRVGDAGANYKRESTRIISKKSWNYFLAAMRFSHTPFGCSVWPSFWMLSTTPGADWPNGGELDVLEYANNVPSAGALHLGDKNHCQLHAPLLNKEGCPSFPDKNKMDYDCTTAYFVGKQGCAPTKIEQPGSAWSGEPGVMAVEWTEDYVKIFLIPDADIPADLLGDTPKPDTWKEEWIISYYPFAASEKAVNGSCPNPSKVMTDQEIVFNIAMCGDWAGGAWNGDSSCKAKTAKSGCTVNIWDPANDCCTKFATDPANNEYFRNNAYFNISWLKIYQDQAQVKDSSIIV